MNYELRTKLVKLNSTSLRILDLGFGSPTTYINLFEELEQKDTFYFIGVELKAESEVSYMRPYGCENFDQHFKFYYNTSILDYLKNISKEEKFDAIILSNILHKIEIIDIPFIMNMCRSLMSENGIIYVCVLGINYEGENDVSNKLFTLERYNSLKEKLDVLWCEENENCHLEFIAKRSNQYLGSM